MRNIFTDYLKENGWQESSPMTYAKIGNDYEIFFDNSNAIEIYGNGKRVIDLYLSDLKDLVDLLTKLA